MELKIVEVYTDLPGSRYEIQGPYSGERFREEILYPAFIKCIENDEKLIINLDGGYGYGSSFIEEVFGGLVRKLKTEKKIDCKKVLDIVIISNDNIYWVDKIEKYIREAIKN